MIVYFNTYLSNTTLYNKVIFTHVYKLKEFNKKSSSTSQIQYLLLVFANAPYGYRNPFPLPPTVFYSHLFHYFATKISLRIRSCWRHHKSARFYLLTATRTIHEIRETGFGSSRTKDGPNLLNSARVNRTNKHGECLSMTYCPSSSL